VLRFDVGRFQVIVLRLLDGSVEVTQTTLLQTLGADIAGGWSQLDVTNLDDMATQASQAAISNVYSRYQILKGQQFSSIISAQSQVVVDGINYKFLLEFMTPKDAKIDFLVDICRKPDGTYQVTYNWVEGVLHAKWIKLDAQNLDTYAEQAANMAIAQVTKLLQSVNGQFDSIETARSQVVVAGINYQFHLQFFGSDGGRVHYEVIVWRQVSGTYVVTSTQIVN